MPDATSVVADSKVYIGGTITDATLASFEDVARVYTEIKSVTDIGEFGDTREIVTAKTISGGRVRKKPGTRDAGDAELVFLRDPLDPGQIALRAAADTNSAYAIKIVANDAPVGGTPTVHYLKAYIAGVKSRLGEADKFVENSVTLALDAAPLTVEAEVSGGIPDNTVLPVITGTAKVATALTASAGTWTGTPAPTYTYQWFANGESITGATASTYTPTVPMIGKTITVKVTGRNAVGQTEAFSAATSAVVA